MSNIKFTLANFKFVLLSIGFAVLVTILANDTVSHTPGWVKLVSVLCVLASSVVGYFAAIFNAPGSTFRGSTSKGHALIFGWLIPMVIAAALVVTQTTAVY